MTTNYKQPLIVMAHIVVIVLAYSSPFWLDWKLIVAGVVLNYIQVAILGGCILSHAQFDDKKQTFHEWYLKKLGFHPNRKFLNLFLRYAVPLLLVAISLIVQVILYVQVIAVL